MPPKSLLMLAVLSSSLFTTSIFALDLSKASDLLENNKYKKALKTLEKQKKEGANNAQYQALLATTYTQLELLEHAKTAYKRSLQINPDQRELRNNYARLLSNIGQTDIAIIELTTALQTDPVARAIHENLSALYEAKMKAAYRQALKVKADENKTSLALLALPQTLVKPEVVEVSEPLLVAQSNVKAAPPKKILSAVKEAKPSSAKASTNLEKSMPSPTKESASERKTKLAVKTPASIDVRKTTSSGTKALITNSKTAQNSRAAEIKLKTVPMKKIKPAAKIAAQIPVKPAIVKSVPVKAKVSTVVITKKIQPKVDTKTALGLSNDLQFKLKQRLVAWSGAWSSRNAPLYATFYTPDFRGKQKSHRAWLDDRTVNFGKKKSLDIKLQHIELKFIDTDKVSARFHQYYRSDSYQDAILKHLSLVKRNGQWLISEEVGLKVLNK